MSINPVDNYKTQRMIPAYYSVSNQVPPKLPIQLSAYMKYREQSVEYSDCGNEDSLLFRVLIFGPIMLGPQSVGIEPEVSTV